MPTIPELKNRRRDLLRQAQDIVDRAQDADRNLTEAEAKSAHYAITEVDKIDAEILRAKSEIKDPFAGFTPGPVTYEDSRPGVGPQMKALHEAARSRQSLSVTVDRKAFVGVTMP